MTSANASNELLMVFPRLKAIVLLSVLVLDLRRASRRDAAHTSLTIRKPSKFLGLAVAA